MMDIAQVPSLLREKGYRFFFYAYDQIEPAHVHISKEDRRAKFWLNPVELARNQGFRAHELSAIERIIVQHQTQFIEAWHEYVR